MRKIGTIGKVNGKVIFKEVANTSKKEKETISQQLIDVVEKTILTIGGFES